MAWLGERKYQPLYEADRKLAWMTCLFDVVVFYVGYLPSVRWIFAKWIAGKFPLVRALKVFFFRILRGDANGIEIENVVVTFGKPENCFVTTGKSFLAVQAVAERPNDPVAELKTVVLEERIEDRVKREDFSIVYVVADLPAD